MGSEHRHPERVEVESEQEDKHEAVAEQRDRAGTCGGNRGETAAAGQYREAGGREQGTGQGRLAYEVGSEKGLAVSRGPWKLMNGA